MKTLQEFINENINESVINDKIIRALEGKDIDDAEDILKKFGEPEFVDEKIDDGADDNENKYIMLRSYTLKLKNNEELYIRISFGDETREISNIDINK